MEPRRGLRAAADFAFASHRRHDESPASHRHLGEDPACRPIHVLLLIRVSMGWGFFLTGGGKMLNLDRTTRYFDSLNLPMPKFQAILAGSTEMIGGLLLTAGLGTRVISVPLAITMVVAYLTAHREDAFASLSDFTDQDPFPFLMAALVSFAFGAGKFSIDRLLQPWLERTTGNNRISS